MRYSAVGVGVSSTILFEEGEVATRLEGGAVETVEARYRELESVRERQTGSSQESIRIASIRLQ